MKRQKLNKYLPQAFSVAIILVGAYGIYLLLEPVKKDADSPPITSHFQPSNYKTSNNTLTQDQIESWHLFGSLATQSTGSSDDTINRETSLPLSIRGLLSNKTGDGWAIISTKTKEEKIVKRGMEIRPGIRVARLAESYAVIENNGIMERLNLSDFSSFTKSEIKKSKKTTDRIEEEKDNDDLDGTLQALKRAGLKRVSEKNASGYIVTSKDKKANTQFNLKKGDILKSVNGYPVGSDAADHLAYEIYRKTGKADIEISRSGKTIYLNYPL